jgi:hypothetical protein
MSGASKRSRSPLFFPLLAGNSVPANAARRRAWSTDQMVSRQSTRSWLLPPRAFQSRRACRSLFELSSEMNVNLHFIVDPEEQCAWILESPLNVRNHK